MRVRWLVAVALLVSLSACGDASSLELSGVADPYAGPLASSATKALECTGEVYESGRGNYDTGPEAIQDDADAALANWLEEESFGRLPDDGYVLEREDDGRVLFSYDVAGLTKVALIAHASMKGYDGTGWGIESYAACDQSELPAEVSDALMYDVWTAADGTRVPTSTVRSSPGPEHCGYEATTVITLGDFDTGDSYYGNPVASLGKYLRTTYAEDVPLPADAEDSGYSRDGLRLWLVPAADAAYLVGADGQADRWPASKEPIYCA